MWLNGQLISRAGEVGTSQSSYKPSVIKKPVFISANIDKLELVIQVANFHYRQGGLRSSFSLGLPSTITQPFYLDLIKNYFLMGCFLILGIYHFVIFALRRHIYPALAFGVLCLMLAIWIMPRNYQFMVDALPWFSYPWQLKIEYMSFFLIVPTFYIFSLLLYPKEVSNYFAYSFISCGIFCFIVTLFLPTIISSSIILRAYQYASFPAGIYVAYYSILAILRHRTGAKWFLIGSALFLLTGLNDILHSLNLIESIELTGYGFLLLMLAQAIMLASIFSRTFDRVEALSQRLLSLDKLKDEFLANTSHELRTPLNGIIGIADSLLAGAAGSISDTVQKNLQLIVSSGRRLASMVNDLLDFSKLQNQDLSLERQAIDLHTLAELILALLKPLTANKNLKLINKIPKHLPAVYADENRLRQVLHNLLGNAIKFTETGEVALSAEVKGSSVTLAVTDTGIGIAKDQQHLIFDSFAQGEASNQRKYEGTGLGLSITKQLVELHEGKIWLESELGQGSTFYVSLPLAEPNKALAEKLIVKDAEIDTTYLDPIPFTTKLGNNQAPLTITSEEAFPEGKLLLVDDDPINLQVLVNYLSTQGYTLAQANHAKDALELMRKGFKPDLAIIDVMMPDMTGIELTQQLRHRYPANELPILMLTAKAQSDDVVISLEAGANDYLIKPAERKELLARIKTHLNIKQLTEEKLQLEQVAFMDNLTGIPNRRHLQAEMERLLDSKSKEFWPLSIFYIDLDKFKKINDTYGHDVGDAVLIHVADCLKKTLRHGDIVARLGGDEFIALVIEADLETANLTKQRLMDILSQPFDALGHKLSIQVSIGMALYPQDGQDSDGLLKIADQAMYRVKQTQVRGNYV